MLAKQRLNFARFLSIYFKQDGDSLLLLLSILLNISRGKSALLVAIIYTGVHNIAQHWEFEAKHRRAVKSTKCLNGNSECFF